jgi:hypothetical protein
VDGLHDVLIARIDELEETARAAQYGRGGLSVSWPRAGGKDALVAFWNADPITAALRGYAEDRDVLRRHVARASDTCQAHRAIPWPCPDVLSVARRHDVQLPGPGR